VVLTAKGKRYVQTRPLRVTKTEQGATVVGLCVCVCVWSGGVGPRVTTVSLAVLPHMALASVKSGDVFALNASGWHHQRKEQAPQVVWDVQYRYPSGNLVLFFQKLENGTEHLYRRVEIEGDYGHALMNEQQLVVLLQFRGEQLGVVLPNHDLRGPDSGRPLQFTLNYDQRSDTLLMSFIGVDVEGCTNAEAALPEEMGYDAVLLFDSQQRVIGVSVTNASLILKSVD